MKLDLSIPEVKTSTTKIPTSVSISLELNQSIREIKACGDYETRLFNELHRQALEQIVQAFKSGAVFKKVS